MGKRSANNDQQRTLVRMVYEFCKERKLFSIVECKDDNQTPSTPENKKASRKCYESKQTDCSNNNIRKERDEAYKFILTTDWFENCEDTIDGA